MIDLSKSKEVTAVLNFQKLFFQNFEHIISVCGHQDLSYDILSDPMYFQWSQTTSGTQTVVSCEI